MAQAVIFDFDGVIVDTEPLYWKAAEVVLKALNMPPVTKDELAVLTGNAYGFQRVLEQRGISDEENEAIRVERRNLMKGMLSELTPLPGVKPLLDGLRERNVPLGMATGARRGILEAMLSALQLRPYFGPVVTFEDVSSHKPHPEVYLKAASALCVAPESCVAFEDSPLGIGSAKAAGCTVIGVKTPSAIFPQDFGQADYVFGDLTTVTAQWLADL